MKNGEAEFVAQLIDLAGKLYALRAIARPRLSDCPATYDESV
jgi:hypothetical protein